MRNHGDMLRLKLLIFGFILMFSVSGCGQKGALYIAQKNLQKPLTKPTSKEKNSASKIEQKHQPDAQH